MAAATLSENGLNTLLIEKRAEVGTPIRCAEALAKQSFERVIKPRDRWIAQVVNGGYAHSPSGISVGKKFKEVGYVLDRKIFDRDLFAIAGERGAHTFAKTEALGLTSDNGYCRKVTIQSAIFIRPTITKITAGAWWSIWINASAVEPAPLPAMRKITSVLSERNGY